MHEFKKYKRLGEAEAREYVQGEFLDNISVPIDLDPLLLKGGMIARDPANHDDQWYIPQDYFDANFKTDRNIAEDEIEQEIQAKTLDAPRLTPDAIDEQIVYEMYHRFDNTTVTVCMLGLKNGFSVIGESAAVSLENFDKEIGKKIARANAREKIWQLEGYRLKQHLYEERNNGS